MFKVNNKETRTTPLTLEVIKHDGMSWLMTLEEEIVKIINKSDCLDYST